MQLILYYLRKGRGNDDEANVAPLHESLHKYKWRLYCPLMFMVQFLSLDKQLRACLLHWFIFPYHSPFHAGMDFEKQMMATDVSPPLEPMDVLSNEWCSYAIQVFQPKLEDCLAKSMDKSIVAIKDTDRAPSLVSPSYIQNFPMPIFD